MAMTGSVRQQIASGKAIYVVLEWSATQNTSTRTASITSKLYIQSTHSAGQLHDAYNRSVVINNDGNRKQGSANTTVTGNQKKLVMTHTSSHKYGADGKLRVHLSGSVNFGGVVGVGNVITGQYFDLDPMTAPSAQVSDIELGKSSWLYTSGLPYTIKRKSSDTKHRYEIVVDGVVVAGFSPTSLSGNFSEVMKRAEWKKIFQTSPESAEIRLFTYSLSKGNLIGSSSTDIPMRGPSGTSAYLSSGDLQPGLYQDINLYPDSELKRDTLDANGFGTELILRRPGYSRDYGKISFTGLPSRKSISFYDDFMGADLIKNGDGTSYYFAVKTYYSGLLLEDLDEESDNFPILFREIGGPKIGDLAFKAVDKKALLTSGELVFGYSEATFIVKKDQISSQNAIKTLELWHGFSTYDMKDINSIDTGRIFNGPSEVTLYVEDIYGLSDMKTFYMATVEEPRFHGTVNAVRQGLTEKVRVTAGGTIDSLGGVNKITSLKASYGGTTKTLPFSQTGDRVASTGYVEFNIPIDKSATINVNWISTLGSGRITGSVPAVKPLFYIGSEQNNIGFGKYPSGGERVESSYPIYAPKFIVEEGKIESSGTTIQFNDWMFTSNTVSKSRGAGTVYFENYVHFEKGTNLKLDIPDDLSISTLETSGGVKVNGTLYVDNSAEFDWGITFNKEPEQKGEEVGFCGVGAYNAGQTRDTIIGVGVNFKTKRYYRPSSITLDADATNFRNGIGFSDVNENGFWLALNGAGNALYTYWRGTYTVG